MTQNQTISPASFSNSIPTVTIHTKNRTPSWKRYGDGSSNIEFRATGIDPQKPASGWLEITASETAFAENEQKRDVTKEVMGTVGLEGMRALRDMLNNLNLDDIESED